MKPPMLLAGLALGVLLIILMKGRKHRPTTIEKLRGGLDEALHEVEGRSADSRKRAKKLSGDARRRVEDQAHDLESKQRERRGKLEDLAAEARHLVEERRS